MSVTDLHELIPTSRTNQIKVMKRDGTTAQGWDSTKIRRAITKAAADAKTNLDDTELNELIDVITNRIMIKDAASQSETTVDNIQEQVKHVLMQSYPAVAEQYIIYANRRKELRESRLKPAQVTKGIQDFCHMTRYAKYVENKKRRELKTETITRSYEMHTGRYPQAIPQIDFAFDRMRTNKVLSSQRSMQFGGKAQLEHHAKGYNCSFSVCNRMNFFSEAFYLLLCGTGVGFSVQFHHVEELPPLKFIDPEKVKHVIVNDDIEGWAEAARELIRSYVLGYHVEFAYNRIRDKNERLRTSGGRAPGHMVLKRALEKVRELLHEAQGRRLEPIECYDLTCHLANAVYAGGIREAALICLFSIDDPFMMRAKTGEWHKTNPQRARSNNSVMLLRDDVKKDQFKRIFKSTKEWGEPGFYFTDDLDAGTNPCVEIGLNSKLTITQEVKDDLEAWAKKYDKKIPNLKVGQTHWGWQFCNLSEVNCAAVKDEEDFYDAIKAASIIGTLQAAYQDFPYLGWVTEAICHREALLGVSLTGMVDKPDIAFNPEIQRKGAQVAIDTNIEMAKILGINPAARVTCVKPSGTSSLSAGLVGSGIHAHHARRYFRRIRANPSDPAYQYFKSINPHMCVKIDSKKDLIIFPVEAPAGAIVRKDLTALQFLEQVLATQRNWVISGTARPDSSPGIRHNVSNTVTVKADEWDDVCNFIWNNKEFFSGVSLLSDYGDKEYENAPREEVVTEKDEANWKYIIDNYKPVDWEAYVEEDDNTNLASESGCAGGACVVSY